MKIETRRSKTQHPDDAKLGREFAMSKKSVGAVCLGGEW